MARGGSIADFLSRSLAAVAAPPLLLLAGYACESRDAPHYVLVESHWAGGCELVSKINPATGEPVRFERCPAEATVRNDGGKPDQYSLPVVIINAYSTLGLTVPASCEYSIVVPVLDKGQTATVRCNLEYVLLTPSNQIDTSRPPRVDVANGSP